MGRRLAFYSYGKFDVVIPDGREQQVDEDRIQNGYIARNPGQQMGRFDFGFIRQDATINLEAQTSDLELAIDSTEKRSEGDVYVERDISRAGMNGFELGRDFGLDDIVSYRVWGNYLRLPVTAGDLESSVDGGLRGVRVHVGGQVASDSEARRRANNEILGQIENEKRQRLRQVNAESRARTAAISAESRRSDAYADAAVSGVESRLSRDFEASYERYSKALTQLGDTWRQELKNGLSAEQQARVEALRQEQLAREKAGTDLRGQLEKTLDDAVARERKARESAISSESSARQQAISAEAQARALADSEEARARQKAISDLSQSFTTDLQAYGELVKEAKNYVDPATQRVVNFWSKENQNNFNKAVQLTLAAQSAYNDINNIKWVSNDAWQAQQEKINEARSKFEAQQLQINAQNEEFRRLTEQLDAQQNEQIEQLTAVQQQMAEESQGQIRELMATPAGTSDPNVRVQKQSSGAGWEFIITEMVGGSMFNIQWFNSIGSTTTGGTELAPSRSVVSTLATSSTGYKIQANPDHALVFVRWAAATKKQVSVNKSGGGWDISRSSWTYVMSADTPSKTVKNVSLRLKVTWQAATHDDNYGIRIRAGDRILKKYNMTGLGPATAFGDGERWMSVMVSNVTVYAGETIKVDVFSTATLSAGRRVKSAELTGTWIEEV
ncbi:hypothetical protein ACLI1L_000815 [Corynebacterium sp. LaCa117]|uniref:hypothetical protein n=1 Tax=Corynebacterium sp. LaCa117 TaxID=3391424 RepID=UPI003989CFE2